MLECLNLSCKIKGKTILNKVNFRLRKADNLLVLGPSGSGKTTLLSLLSGLQEPSSGSVKYDDVDIYQLKSDQRDKFRGENLGIIFQNFHLIKSLNLYQNIAIASQMLGRKIDEIEINNYLKELGLEDRAHEKISNLSIGQCQRLAVIRSFINKPKWILCDEPTSALDDENCDKLLKLLKSQSKKNKSSLIIVTHDQRVKSHFKKDNILQL